MSEQETSKKKRGFASLTPEQRKEIASKGGKAAHAKGTAHKFNHDEAVAAGSKGGIEVHRKGTAHKFRGRNVIEQAKEFLETLNPADPPANKVVQENVSPAIPQSCEEQVHDSCIVECGTPGVEGVPC